MDLQSRTTEYGVGRHHAHAEIEARCLTPLLADAKNGGITRGPGVGFACNWGYGSYDSATGAGIRKGLLAEPFDLTGRGERI